jgi:uncharacterized protein (TIGR03435 family)
MAIPRAAALASTVAFFAAGQSPQTAPAFEVASVKLVPPPIPTGGGAWTVTHGRFRAETGYVRGMIAWGYEVPPGLVKGGPEWMDREVYSVDAKAEDPEAGPEQIRAMLKSLLIDRFKIGVHRETKEGQVYKLQVAKGGSKLQDAKGGRRNYINWTGLGRVTFTENTTLLGLINILSDDLGAPVIDETGITGSHNFSLEFLDPRFPRPTQGDSPPELPAALQEQLGLRLEAARAPIEFLVVDRLERPSAN